MAPVDVADAVIVTTVNPMDAIPRIAAVNVRIATQLPANARTAMPKVARHVMKATVLSLTYATKKQSPAALGANLAL